MLFFGGLWKYRYLPVFQKSLETISWPIAIPRACFALQALATMMLGNIMYQADFNPLSECFRFFSSFACGGPWGGRHFYTRKERIEALERTKGRLQDEITAIDEMIADLKNREPKQA